MYYDEGSPAGESPRHQHYALSGGQPSRSQRSPAAASRQHAPESPQEPLSAGSPGEGGYDFYDYQPGGESRYGTHVRDPSTLSSDYDMTAHRRRSGGCLITGWAFCIVGVAILAIPLVFLLLPYIKASFFAATEAPPGHVLPKTDRPPMKTVAPDQCPRMNAKVRDAEKMSDVPSERLSAGPNAPPNGPQPVYCLFNVSRFRRPSGYFFLAQHLPLALCPSIVYWSWSLPDGNLTSRAEEFDKKYGLAVIKDVARVQRVNVDVILTLGGYPEDSADFHKVGENDKVRHLLAQGTYDMYRKYDLSGVNLHWVPNKAACESPFKDPIPRLVEFIDNLRRLVTMNAPSAAFKVTAIVNVEDVSTMKFFRVHQSKLNVTFFKIHQMPRGNSFSDDYCNKSVPVFAYHMGLVAPFFGTPPVPGSVPPSQPQKYEGLCVSMSLALYAGSEDDTERPAPPQPVSQTPGRMALFEVCDFKIEFKDFVKPVPGCLLRRTLSRYLNVTIALDDRSTLQTKMSQLGKPEDLCVLLYDVDFDNYRAGCSQRDERYVMLQHFYSARITSSAFDVTDHLPKQS
ncbi:hypothetical protein HPB49_009920 [Dermacentor silvarum]|uniref:Uncharacterized protein n=1 Tax=Dermacentor silvarum TaxID=543639 RepID=A0ACB8D4J4_DERSI|nr:hypothetical protein HPB49_009920 [Dermacentor silvarum]